MANIIIPSLLQSFTDGKSRVEVPGKTLRQAIENLDEISRDRIDFGSGILPWISFKGITVS